MSTDSAEQVANTIAVDIRKIRAKYMTRLVPLIQLTKRSKQYSGIFDKVYSFFYTDLISIWNDLSAISDNLLVLKQLHEAYQTSITKKANIKKMQRLEALYSSDIILIIAQMKTYIDEIVEDIKMHTDILESWEACKLELSRLDENGQFIRSMRDLITHFDKDFLPHYKVYKAIGY